MNSSYNILNNCFHQENDVRLWTEDNYFKYLASKMIEIVRHKQEVISRGGQEYNVWLSESQNHLIEFHAKLIKFFKERSVFLNVALKNPDKYPKPKAEYSSFDTPVCIEVNQMVVSDLKVSIQLLHDFIMNNESW